MGQEQHPPSPPSLHIPEGRSLEQLFRWMPDMIPTINFVALGKECSEQEVQAIFKENNGHFVPRIIS